MPFKQHIDSMPYATRIYSYLTFQQFGLTSSPFHFCQKKQTKIHHLHQNLSWFSDFRVLSIRCRITCDSSCDGLRRFCRGDRSCSNAPKQPERTAEFPGVSRGCHENNLGIGEGLDQIYVTVLIVVHVYEYIYIYMV